MNVQSHAGFWWSVLRFVLVAGLLATIGCKKSQLQPTDTAPLDEAGMFFNNVDQLRDLHMTNAEVQQLVLARQAGVSDPGCVELVRLARTRGLVFTNGEVIAGLISAGLRENSVVELDRLNQFDSWGGQAQILRLAGISDEVILDAAHRRAASLSVLSAAKISDLQNAGLSQRELLAMIDRGTTDAEADAFIKRKNYLAGGHGFVHQQRRRR
jgi:hypothetical protein